MQLEQQCSVLIFTLRSGVGAAAPPLMRRVVDEFGIFVVLAMGDPGWMTAKAELVPARSATRNKGFKAIMMDGIWIQVTFEESREYIFLVLKQCDDRCQQILEEKMTTTHNT